MKPLWNPSVEAIASAHITKLISKIEVSEGIQFKDFQSFYKWSVDEPKSFWKAVWEDCNIIHSQPYSSILEDEHMMPGAKWFPGAQLNFAKNLLRYSDDRDAIVYWNEEGRQRVLSFRELNREVAKLATALQTLGVKAGDRVSGWLPNIPEAVIGMLATTALGAVWSSCSPDFTDQGVLDRFGQVKPKVIFSVDSYIYKGKAIGMEDKLSRLVEKLDSLEQVILVENGPLKSDLNRIKKAARYSDLVASNGQPKEIPFCDVPSSSPVYILYSSGTTGAPKCIVHGVVGILAEHFKELKYDINLVREDRFFYNTTCGWMMWNWLVSGLGLGATIVLYDGFPLAEDGEILFRMLQAEGVTVFGTSAGYLQKIEELGMVPKSKHNLTKLRAVFSTGSRLKPTSFDFVYSAIGDVHLSPIWGGTDLCGCLGTASPVLPVVRDELQTRSLGIAVDVVNEKCETVKNIPGEVIVRKPFPSMPIYFLNDPDGNRYRAAYFEYFPGVWRHSDWAVLTERGTLTVLGRSDDTLNPGGVRIGAAEVTSAAERVEGVLEAMVVAQEWNGDERIILFVILKSEVNMSDQLQKAILSNMPSPRHRPAKIFSVSEFPLTLNGKRSVQAVREVIKGVEVSNEDALANPQCLSRFIELVSDLRC